MAEDKPFKQILILAAENSAENYGAQIVEQFNLKGHGPNDSSTEPSQHVQFFGVGGDRMQKQGVELIFHNKELSVVGIIEVIAHLRKLKKIMNRLIDEAVQRKADAVLLIDYPDFNLRLAKKLKKAGIPVYYYISPTVWAWRYSRVETIKKYVDHLFIIFPFEKAIYSKEEISHTYVGHPLLPMIRVTRERSDFRAQHNIPEERIMVTLLPGSRKSEVHFLLEEMLAAMQILDKTYDLEVFLMKADSIDHEILSPYLEACPLHINVIPQEQGYNSINASDIVLGTCGTSNLEIAVLGVPFTAGYRVNKLSYALGKGFVKIDLYSIVNILAGKEVIKELIQENYTHQNIVAEMRRILDSPEVREEMPQPDRVAILPLDLGDLDTLPGIVQKALVLFGSVDILVNNAGISQRSLIVDTEMEVYEKLVRVNYLGTVALSKALLPHFIQRKQGHFAVVTSLMGKFGSPLRSGYCGAKHALHGFFDVLRMEHEKDGVFVSMICPGFVQTDLARNALVGDGSSQGFQDQATNSGMDPDRFARKMLRAIEKRSWETCIGGREVAGIYLKRFFPKLLHKVVMRSQVV